MPSGIRTVTYPVHDLDAARTLYRTVLGVEPYVDEPYYVGFRVDDDELGLDPNGHAKGMTGPVTYWHVRDIQERVDELRAAGAEVAQEPTGVGGGMLVATVTDADGNAIELVQVP
jgi:predicted enzyme related to lactoylglutathione lyase